jgi:predicted nucleotide-binding protein
MLKTQLQRGEELERAGVPESLYATWVSETEHWVEQSFGENSSKAREFADAGFIGSIVTSATDFAQLRREALAGKLNTLRAFTNILKETVERLPTAPGPERGTADGAKAITPSTRVFVVHGHDAGAKETVARFLQKLDLHPVILHEQPNAGRTLIEKFEANADVSFAVVLLTPDDRGGPAVASYEKQSGRARQNVILELGYFLGRLGRERVCALCEEGTEVPSDLHGVVYVPIDSSGAWRFRLAKELKLVFPAVDLNKAM